MLVTRIRPISTALLLMSLGLQAQSQTASRAPPGSASAPSQAAPKGGINALLDSVRTSGDDFLPPDRAFRFDALPDGTDRVRLNWEIADGYYLYRARIKVMTPSTRAQLGAPQMPQGQIKSDEYFGRQEVYHHELVAAVPVVRATGGAFELPLQVTYQGCADAGLCYPPITNGVTVNLSAGAAAPYTLAGIACAAAGRQVQAVFQQWWVLALFAALFVVLALSMFGLFTLQMPVAIQTRIANISNRQSAGTFGGVAVMGALSALIVTTCVGPALVGALLVISQTGQVARGGAALFALSIGMGTPLLVVGASAGRLLPRAGPWMDLVKKLFGVMMLAVAAWMLARIVPERVVLSLWAVPALILAWLLWSQTRGHSAATWGLRAAGVIAGLYGVVLTAGSALGGTDPLAPIPAFAARA